MKILFLVLVLVGSSTQIRNQELISTNSHFQELPDFSFRTKPILNREYLICLAWHRNIYISFPDKTGELIPERKIMFEEQYLNSSFEQLEETSSRSAFLDNYVFNPKYLDYPVVGLSNKQYQLVSRWMRERYNENQLLNLGYLVKDQIQMDRESFNTEAFLAQQYNGLNSINNIKTWQETKCKPLFRAPSTKELKAIRKVSKISTKLVQYSFDKSDFLWRWNEEYLSIKDNAVVMLDPSGPFILNATEETWTDIEDDYEFQTIPLEHQVKQMKDGFVFGDEAECDEKNRFGEMNFVITGYAEGSSLLIGQSTYDESAMDTKRICLLIHSK